MGGRGREGEKTVVGVEWAVIGLVTPPLPSTPGHSSSVGGGVGVGVGDGRVSGSEASSSGKENREDVL